MPRKAPLLPRIQTPNPSNPIQISLSWFSVLFIFVFIALGYLLYVSFSSSSSFSSSQKIIVVSSPPSTGISSVPITVPTRCWGAGCGGFDPRGTPGINPDIRNTRDIFNDPYIPPVKTDNYVYQQMGILTSISNNTLILPLLGRQHINGRDKWNYYTISNTGSLNTKLPIKVNGKICSNEYGCNQIYSKDIVTVDGYDSNFKVTIYENNTYNYEPVL